MEICLALHALSLFFVFTLVFLRIQSVSADLDSPNLPHKNCLKLFAQLQPEEGRAFEAMKYLQIWIKGVDEYWRCTKPISAP